jgi:hypothetical protein
MQPTIIGVHGKIQHGKDYAAEIVRQFFVDKGFPSDKVVIDHWARPLREYVSRLMGIPYENMLSQQDKNKIYSYIPVNIDSITSYFTGIGYNIDPSLVDMAIKKFDSYFYEKGRLSLGEILQYLATDCMRSIVDQDIWVKCLISHWVKNNRPILIIADCRFPNEIKTIKYYGGFSFRVKRTDLDNIKHSRDPSHESETALDDYDIPTVVNNMDSHFNRDIRMLLNSKS